jgi:hypothetical protein
MTTRASFYKSLGCMLLFGVASVALLMGSSIARADSKISIKPMISASAEYDSNFWRTEENEIGVYTYSIRPGISLGYETARTALFVSYTLNGLSYKAKDDAPEDQREADDENFLGHLFAFNGSYDLTNRLTIGVTDNFAISQVPTEIDSLGPTVNREEYTTNIFEPWVQYRIGDKWSARLSYIRDDIDYDETDLWDNYANSAKFGLNYRALPTLSLNFDYKYTKQEWDVGDREYTSNKFGLGFDKLFNYVSLGATGGYHFRNYQDADLDKDTDKFIWRGFLTWQNPPRSFASSGYSDGYLLGNQYVTLSGGQDFSVQTFYEDHYTNNWGMLNGGIRLGKINLGARLYLSNRDFDRLTGLNEAGQEVIRDDDRYDLSAHIAYNFIYNLSLRFTAGHEEQDSNWAGFDYENNYAMLYLHFNYDLASMGAFRDLGSFYYR